MGKERKSRAMAPQFRKLTIAQWIKLQLLLKNYSGLVWHCEEDEVFKLDWTHGSSSDCSDATAAVFKGWAIYTGLLYVRNKEKSLRFQERSPACLKHSFHGSLKTSSALIARPFLDQFADSRSVRHFKFSQAVTIPEYYLSHPLTPYKRTVGRPKNLTQSVPSKLTTRAVGRPRKISNFDGGSTSSGTSVAAMTTSPASVTCPTDIKIQSVTSLAIPRPSSSPMSLTGMKAEPAASPEPPSLEALTADVHWSFTHGAGWTAKESNSVRPLQTHGEGGGSPNELIPTECEY